MKILILCHTPEAIGTNNKINNQSTIYAYHFNKWLSKYPECSITNCKVNMTLNEIIGIENHDFCIILANRGVKLIGQNNFTELRKKIKYSIITICGSNSIMDKEDLLLFTMGKQKPKTLKLFWGADFELLKPLKQKTIINILVDHKYYGNKKSRMYKIDKTEAFIKSLLKYKSEGHDIVIKHIGFGKIQTVTDDYKIDEFRQAAAIDFREIYNYYNEAHIYVVTHQESFGLTTIECASSGALIVQPAGYIKKEIINRLHHVSVKDVEQINWDDIIKQINIPKSIKKARRFLYSKAVGKVHNYMTKNYNKPDIVEV